jgi:hypothetical protein
MTSGDESKPKKTRVTRKKKTEEPEKPAPKKRGRKPKGGKIIAAEDVEAEPAAAQPNIVLHLKCNLTDLGLANGVGWGKQVNEVVPYETGDVKHESKPFNLSDGRPVMPLESSSEDEEEETSGALSTKTVNRRLRELAVNLHTNNISDKKSACFYCTCDFDNPPISIPKFELEGSYHCYGCFCSPECAAAHLFREHIDASAKMERYSLLNYIYCKIYNYTKNIKPAPDPYHTLDKYYGNLSIQQYRKLLKSERLLLVVDKPLTRSLPELHEENSEFLISKKSIPSSFELGRRGRRKTKTEIMQSAFNFNV